MDITSTISELNKAQASGRKLSSAHVLLISLHDKQERTGSEIRQYNALIKVEIAKAKAKQAVKDAAALVYQSGKAQRAAERKARNHRLILVGAQLELENKALFDELLVKAEKLK